MRDAMPTCIQAAEAATVCIKAVAAANDLPEEVKWLLGEAVDEAHHVILGQPVIRIHGVPE
jgi:hypothetical protein